MKPKSPPPLAFFKVACVGPWCPLSLFWLFVLRARLELGFWPRPYNPDPKDLNFDLHTLALIGALLWALLSAPAVLAALILWPRALLLSRVGAASTALCVVGWALGIAQVQLDPGSFVEWFMD
jgi:hypothetical protein